jgi:hypothetical protein
MFLPQDLQQMSIWVHVRLISSLPPHEGHGGVPMGFIIVFPCLRLKIKNEKYDRTRKSQILTPAFNVQTTQERILGPFGFSGRIKTATRANGVGFGPWLLQMPGHINTFLKSKKSLNFSAWVYNHHSHWELIVLLSNLFY